MAAADSTPPTLTPQQVARFWAKVDRRGPDECWPWAGATIGNSGYGKFTVRLADNPRKPVSLGAHVTARWLATGEWPAGVCTLHNCPGGDNRLCCNPAHLWLGTHAENSADMVAKGRSHKPFRVGEAAHNLKLTEATVLEIRRLYAAGGVTCVQLGRQFGVHRGTIHNIIRRVNWSHLP